MELTALNLKPLDLFYKVLDKFYPKWELRTDDYYLTELAFFILKVYKCPYTSETIVKNLKISRVDDYQKELKKVLDTPLEVYEWILNNRMSKDRLKANQTRYIKAKGK